MFNIEEFDLRLDTEIIGRNFVYLQEVDSTNTTLLNSKEFDQNGTVLFSEFQTNGKGRKNRTWDSNAEQNLTFSVLLNENIENNKINICNLATCLAVAQSIENLFQLKVNLKWPNDVLVNDKKIAGILLESTSRGANIEKLVIGIGINVNQPIFRGVFNYQPTSVKIEFKQVVSREKILSEVLNNLEDLYLLIDSSPQKILDDWKTRSRFLGEKVRVTDDKMSKFGLFEDLDENGFMILNTKEGRETITYGDISLK